MKIVVFGAGGFIGGWICEELAARADVELIACVRHWSSAVRLARRGLNIVQIDLEDVVPGNLAVIADADVVVNASVPSAEREPELAGRLYTACAVSGVRKFIQFSSIAVYGLQTGDIDENAQLLPSSDYGRGKVEMESRLLNMAAESELQLFILRPTIVYGPFSDLWTVRYARRITEGRWRSLGWAGMGICNLVHAADVAQSVIRVAIAPLGLESHVFNINGPAYVTWNEYLDLFGRAMGMCDVRDVNPLIFNLSSMAINGVRNVGSWVKRKGLQRHLKGVRAVTGAAQSLVNLYPSPEELHLLRQKTRYPWDRATRVVGFSPSISLEEGLRQSVEWCRIHGVI